MSSKIITTVLTFAIVVPFAYLATQDAVSIKQDLHEQTKHIQKLNTEYAEIDKKIDKTVQVKQQEQQKLSQLEKEANDKAAERQKLEAEAGAN